MRLAHAGLALGLATSVRMLANLVTIKVIALHVGTTGTGYLGQFMSVMAMTLTLAGGGTAMGLTRAMAAEGTRAEDAGAHVHAALVIWLASGLLFGILLAALAPILSTLVFGTAVYASVFRVLAAAQLLVGAGNFFLAVLNGRHDVQGIVVVNTLSAVVGAALTTVLVISFGVIGGMYGLLVAPCAVFLFGGWRVWRQGHLRGKWRVQHPRWKTYRDLLSFSAVLLVTACAVPLALIVLRRWQEDAFGWERVGIWQGMLSLSDAWLQLATVVLANYYFARLSRCQDHPELHAEVRTTFIACAATLIPTACCIWLLREPVITLVFSSRFLPMQELLGIQLAGDVLRVLAYVLGYVAMARSMIGLSIVAEFYQAGTLLLLSYFFISLYGVRGVPYAYCVTYMLYLPACLALYWRYHVSAMRVRTSP